MKYGEVGEICAKIDTMFLYYEGNMEETTAVKKVHADGAVWLHTGDIGSVDEEGFITLCGRIRRVIVRRSFKISAYTIEDKISEHSAVQECVAVGVTDEDEEYVPMAYVVLKPDIYADKKKIEEELYKKCCRELKEYEVPKYFRFLDKNY